eukprot:199737_1
MSTEPISASKSVPRISKKRLNLLVSGYIRNEYTSKAKTITFSNALILTYCSSLMMNEKYCQLSVSNEPFDPKSKSEGPLFDSIFDVVVYRLPCTLIPS